MNELIESMKVLVATMFAFRIKAQFYHWNIEGPDFIQYHKFLGDLYEQVDGNIDDVAEHIRALGSYSPGSFQRFKELSKIKDEDSIPNALEMLNRLLSDIETLHFALNDSHSKAETIQENGTINFLEGLLDQCEKTRWMIRSILKR